MGQTNVEYYVNGINFADYGVDVSGSTGVTSKLEEKDSLTVDWDNYHGETVSRDIIYYKPRTIKLSCIIDAYSYDDFVNSYRNFLSQFEKPGTQRLKIDVGSKPLVYEVYAKDAVDISKKWDPDHMVGTFDIKLIEPEPVKRVLQATGSASITITTSKRVNIYWGDGTYTYDVYGTKSLTHSYSDSSVHEIIITGVMECISSLSHNCTLVWNRLQ